MATTLPKPPLGKDRRAPGSDGPANGEWHGPPLGGLIALGDSSPASRTGVWVGLAAITMMFAAFTSALVVRQGSAADWQHIDLPSILYLNTLALLASSFTLEVARRPFSRAGTSHPSEGSNSLTWLCLTFGLGLVFLGGQYAAWLKLKSKGVYLATNPSSSFFYMLTAAHALHILGGLAGLGLCIFRLRRPVPELRRSTLSTVAYYWHFMDVLWIYLLALLWFEL